MQWIIISFFYHVFLKPLLLQLQIARKFVVGISSGLFAYFLLALFGLVCFLFGCVEMGAQVKIVVHAKVLKCVLPDLIVSLIGPWEDVVILILCIFLVNPLYSLLSYGPLDLILGLPKGKVDEFLINK